MKKVFTRKSKAMSGRGNAEVINGGGEELKQKPLAGVFFVEEERGEWREERDEVCVSRFYKDKPRNSSKLRNLMA